MNGNDLFHFAVWKFFDIAKEFIIFFCVILLGEWFADKKGYNLFERAWLITIAALSILTFAVWAYWGRLLNLL